MRDGDRRQAAGDALAAIEAVRRLLAELVAERDRLLRQGVAELAASELGEIERAVRELGSR